MFYPAMLKDEFQIYQMDLNFSFTTQVHAL